MPEFRILRPEDRIALETFLKAHLESSMFLLGNARAAGLTDKGRVLQGTYVAAFEQGSIVALAAHYWNQNLIVQAPVHTEAVSLEAVRASGRLVKGVLGPAGQVERVMKCFGVAPSAVQFGETEKLYTLPLDALVLPELLTSKAVRVRLAESDDLDLLTRWRVTYSVETLNETETPQLWKACRVSVRRYQQEERLWLAEVDEKPVACSAFNTTADEAVQVGSVYTPPEHRRQGYARATVAASLLDARTDGATRAVLFTPMSNAAAQRAYETIGFCHVSDYRVVVLKTARAPS